MLKYVNLTCVLTLSTLALSAQVIPAIPEVRTTGMVGIADAQTAQFNLLNKGVQPPATGVVCTAVVSFVDSNGTILKTATVTVAPGNSASVILRSDVDLQLAAGDRREIRATVSMPAVPPPTAAGATVATPACRLMPTLEVLDTVSGRTLVVLGRMEKVPAVVAATPVTTATP